MKHHRTLTWLAVVVLLITLVMPIGMAGAAPAKANAVPASPERTALVQVLIATTDDLARFEETGLPAYARLEGREGNYLLAGATPAGLEALAAAGLSARVLDADMAGATYYLAYPAPNRPRPEWSAYGRLLLDDREQALLRTAPVDAERLSQAGAELRLVTLYPKPLRPTVEAGAIPAVVQPDPLIQAMIDQVTTQQIYDYLRGFAGEQPVWVDDGWYTITTRRSTSGTPILKAAHYLGERYAAQGLDVEYHVWNGGHGPNVIGQYTGLVNPENIYILGGHLDDVTGTPGADDNASGPIAGLIAAEIMTQFQWGCTLRFVGWTGEEDGLLGSDAYAHRSYQLGENILGYLNLDMIAWNTIGSQPDIYLAYNASMPSTLALAQLFDDVVDAYNIDLVPLLGTSMSGGSDHSSFWDHGYTSILGIEGYNDFNPYYHGPQDTVAHTDPTYFTNYVKASLATFAHMSGCLIPSGIGALNGHVTAATGGAPIEGATVTARATSGNTYSDNTDATGYYTQTLLSGTYTVTAEAYGYLPATVTGVEIVTGVVTTQDFALQTAPYYTISGHVTELGSGLPLLAELQFEGSPVTVWTNPADGYYQASLPPGSYTIKVRADLHLSEERPIVVTDGDQIQDFSLEPLACILLVDDDNNAPDTLPYFTAALDAMGLDYDVFDTAGGNGPDQGAMSGYRMVFWFSGDTYGGSAGPNSTDETSLTAYLNEGGRLFLSSQDYLYDMGLTTFGSTYLGIGSHSDDSGNATAKVGVVGDPIGNGLGSLGLTYPSGFSDYGDIVTAGAGASQAFKSSSNVNLDVDKASGAWKTVFFGTDWVPIYNNNATNGTTVLQRIVDWFGGCCGAANILSVTADITYCEVTFGAQLAGTPPFSFAWDFGAFGASADPTPTVDYGVDGTFPYTLTVSNCSDASSDTVTGTVTVDCCDGVTDAGFSWAPGQPLAGEAVVFTGVASGTTPIGFEWAFGDGTTGQGVVVTHTYTLSDTYTVVLTATNDCGVGVVDHDVIVVQLPQRYYIYLPIVVRKP